MLGLRHVLGPTRAVNPERISLATVAALGAAAAPSAVGAVPEAARIVGDSRAATALIALSTAALSAALARRALAASTTLMTRVWLVLGGAGAGFVNGVISFGAAALCNPEGRDAPFGMVLVASLFVGGFFGFLFGTAFCPVVVAAARARLTPSHEGADHVLFTGGATLALYGAARALVPCPLAGALLGYFAGLAGLAALAVASARILARARFAARVREGLETGLHVVPRAHDDDEALLLPLSPAAREPSGVLTATGASAPYRGARGVFKLALVPLPEEPVEHPLQRLFWSSTAAVSDTVLTLILGSVTLTAASLCFGLLALVWSSIPYGR